METKLYDVWLLDDVELNICVRILGFSDWYHIEIEDNQEPLESRMLEGFISLVEKGFLCVIGDHFQPTKRMRELILPLAAPDQIVHVYRQDSSHVYFKRKEGNLVKMEPIQTERRNFRLIAVPEEEIPEFWDLQKEDRVVEEDLTLSENGDDLQAILAHSKAIVLVLDGDGNQQKLLRIFENGEKQ